jgi:hypothetical protein
MWKMMKGLEYKGILSSIGKTFVWRRKSRWMQCFSGRLKNINKTYLKIRGRVRIHIFH